MSIILYYNFKNILDYSTVNFITLCFLSMNFKQKNLHYTKKKYFYPYIKKVKYQNKITILDI